MAKKDTIMRYSAEALRTMAARTDWARLDATMAEEIERQAREDNDLPPEGWQDKAIMGLPPRKEAVNLRLDADVLEWFRRSGKGYQTRINNVLRAFVESRRAS